MWRELCKLSVRVMFQRGQDSGMGFLVTFCYSLISAYE